MFSSSTSLSLSTSIIHHQYSNPHAMVVLNEKKEKKTQGRKRREIKKLENGSNKQVTFSKRRSDLFKKAAELTVLCCAGIAVIIFSPKDKLFSFGNPSVDSIVLRYSHGTDIAAATTSTSTNDIATVPVEEFNRDYIETIKELEAEKSQLVGAKKEPQINGEKYWWEEGIEGMAMEQPRQYMAALHELRRRVAARLQELKAAPKDTSLAVIVPPPSFHQTRQGFGQ